MREDIVQSLKNTLRPNLLLEEMFEVLFLRLGYFRVCKSFREKITVESKTVSVLRGMTALHRDSFPHI